MRGQRGESLLSVIIAVGIMGAVAAVVATTLGHHQNAATSLEVKSDELALRQELRERIDCVKSLVGHNCASAAGSSNFTLIDKLGRPIGVAGSPYRHLAAWSLNPVCKNNLLTIFAARVEPKGKIPTDALTRLPDKWDAWHPVLTSRELACGNLGKPPPLPGCLQGKNTTLCPRSTYAFTYDMGGTFGAFAACGPGEMAYACGFDAGAAYTTGPTYAFPTTVGGVPGCLCNVGVLDTTQNGACAGGGCTPCTGGADPATGCNSSCWGVCVREQ